MSLKISSLLFAVVVTLALSSCAASTGRGVSSQNQVSSDPCYQPTNWAAVSAGLASAPPGSDFFTELGYANRELARERDQQTQCEVALAEQRVALERQRLAAAEQPVPINGAETTDAMHSAPPAESAESTQDVTSTDASTQQSSLNLRCLGGDPMAWDNCVGTVRYHNGNVYDGEFHDGQRSGYGVLTINAIGQSDHYNIMASEPSIYIGQFKNGRLNGQGIIFNKTTFRAFGGPFLDNIFMGASNPVNCRSTNAEHWDGCFGVQRHPNGNIYFGEFSGGVRSGLGLIKISAQGVSDSQNIAAPSTPSIYVGQFLKGRINGRGMLLTPDDGIFGFFINNVYVGQDAAEYYRLVH
jgi:hypothetical protein